MSHATTLFLPTKQASFVKDLAVALVASVAIGLCSQISIPLPFTPIPLTVQNSLVLLLSVLLGSRRGGSAVFFFLLQGSLGLPVFAGAAGGFLTFFGPTGGYLLGYLAAAFLTGWLMERSEKKTVLTTCGAMAAGNLVIYTMGALYLSTFIGLKQALLLGVAPFIVGDLFKIALSIKALQWMRPNRYTSRDSRIGF